MTEKKMSSGLAVLPAVLVCLALAAALCAAPAGEARASELMPAAPAQMHVKGKVSIKKAEAAKVKKLIYTGKARKPKLKLTYKGKALKAGTDYKVSYKSNVNAGTAKAVVTGKGKYKGKKTVKFKIAKASIAKAKVAKVAAQPWTGEAAKPALTVKYKGRELAQGTDYTVSYKSNTSPGTATATVKGKGNLKGKTTVKFELKSPKLVREVVYTFNSDGCQMFTSNPTTLYVPKVPEVNFGKEGVATVDNLVKVNGKPTTSYVYKASIDDPSRGKTVVMPDGLAEALRHKGGYEFTASLGDYIDAWMECLGMAAASETSLTEYCSWFDIDCPLWFSKALYEIDQQSFSPVGNFSSASHWVVKA